MIDGMFIKKPCPLCQIFDWHEDDEGYTVCGRCGMKYNSNEFKECEKENKKIRSEG